MIDIEARLGGRLPLLEPGTLDGPSRDLFDLMDVTLIPWAKNNGFEGKDTRGRLIGPFNAYLYSTGITPGFLQWMHADGGGTSLDKKVHEIVILTVGAIWKSPYELYAHSAVARTVGVPEVVVEALAKGETPDALSLDELIAHRFARQLTVERRVEEALYREAEASFGRVGLVDMVYLVGMYLLTCALLNAFEVPKPE